MRPALFALFVALAGLTTGCGKTTPATPNETPDSGPGAAPEQDRDRLQGVWAIESYEPGDLQNVPKPGELQSVRFVFNGGTLRIVIDGEDKVKSSLGLDTTSNPHVMIVTELDSEGKPRRRFAPSKDEGEIERQEWIYKFDGDILVIAMSEGRGPRPTEFKPKAGSGSRATKRTDADPGTPPVAVIRLKKTNEPVPAEKPRRSSPAGATKK